MKQHRYHWLFTETEAKYKESIEMHDRKINIHKVYKVHNSRAGRGGREGGWVDEAWWTDQLSYRLTSSFFI